MSISIPWESSYIVIGLCGTAGHVVVLAALAKARLLFQPDLLMFIMVTFGNLLGAAAFAQAGLYRVYLIATNSTYDMVTRWSCAYQPFNLMFNGGNYFIFYIDLLIAVDRLVAVQFYQTYI